jgi:excisionase family DNA binding protein
VTFIRSPLTAGQAALILGCSRATVWRLATTGLLQGWKLPGGAWRFPPEEVERVKHEGTPQQRAVIQ